jgi:O-antigen/teichoic acid export membrane protein
MKRFSKNKHFTDFSFLFTSSVFGQSLRILRSFIVASLIGPLYFGAISGLSIFLLYIPLLQLGYFQQFSKIVPQLISKGKIETIKTIETNGVAVSIITGLIGMLIYFIFYAINVESYTKEIKIIWILYSVVIVLQPITQYYTAVYSVDGRFKRLSLLNLLQTLFFFALLIMVYKWNYLGQVLSLGISAIALVGLFIYYKRIVIYLDQFSVKLIMDMIKRGFPILFSAFIFNVFTTVDRLFILSFRGIEEYGYYAIGVTLFQLALVIPTNVRLISYRIFNLEFGKTSEESHLNKSFWSSFSLVFILMWIVSVLSYFITPLFIEWFLPKFIKSIDIVKVFSIAISFVSSGLILSNALYTINKDRTVLYIYGISLGLFVIVGFVLKYLDAPSFYMAVAMCVSHFVSWLFMYLLLINQKEYKLKRSLLGYLTLIFVLVGFSALFVTAGIDLIFSEITILMQIIVLLIYFTGTTLLGLQIFKKIQKLKY